MNTALKTYSPANLCQWFEIPRTTLFRWETTGEIPKAGRDSRGQRVYNERHLKAVAQIIRNKAEEQIALAVRHDDEGPNSSPALWERVYLAEVFGGTDGQHGLRQLHGLALRSALSNHTLEVLVEYAMQLPPGSPMRIQIWDIAAAYDRSIGRQG